MNRETKTVLVSITRTPQGLIVQGAIGAPAIVPNGEPQAVCAALGSAVNDVVEDPTQPAHELSAAGFNVQDMFRGLGRFLETMGQDGEPE